MDPLHRGLYVRWLQSSRVELVVGEDASSSDASLLFPQEFLQRRSRVLRQQIEQPHDEKAIPLSDTTAGTLEEFFIWSHNRNPQLDDSLSFSEIVNLGIFAEKYQIPALSNQVTDRIRANLASSEWQLQATVVDAIYQATVVNSPLREVVKAALGQLSRSNMDGEEWAKTFVNNAEFGYDYFRAGGKEWARQDYLSGVCRYHNHDGIKRQEGLCDGCPYAEADCYPVWEEDTKHEVAVEQEEVPEHTWSVAAVEEAPPAEAEEAVPEEPEYAAAEPEWAVGEPEPEPEWAAEEPEYAVAEPQYAAEEPAAETMEHEEILEEVQAAEDVDEAVEVNVNGHVNAEEAEETLEEADGAETPHANGFSSHAVADEAQSESLDQDSSDRENIVVPEVNGISSEKNREQVTVTAVPASPKLSKNQKKKRARKMSIQQ